MAQGPSCTQAVTEHPVDVERWINIGRPMWMSAPLDRVVGFPAVVGRPMSPGIGRPM